MSWPYQQRGSLPQRPSGITSCHPKRNQLSGRFNGALTHLHLAVGLQQLGNRHLVLLQSPLHQLGAANVDGALHVRRVVLGKRPAVNHQQAARPSLDEARQPLDVHHASFVGPFLPCHDVGRDDHPGSQMWEQQRRVDERGKGRDGGEEEVSGGGLPPEQALRDPWCLKREEGKYNS